MPLYKPTQSELTSFCEGMYKMYEFGRNNKTELVLFPLRGAYPFSLAYQKIAELNNEEPPDMLLLPLGTFFDATTKSVRGLTKPEKIDIVNPSLDDYFEDKPDTLNLLLVDEVMHGGTILTHYHMIKKYLDLNSPSATLNVCAIEDGAREQRKKYQNQAEKYGFHRIKVESLFVMDREQYLPKIVKNKEFSIHYDNKKLEDILLELERMHSSKKVM